MAGAVDPEYDPLTGIFTRKGRGTGTTTKAGYVVLRYRGALVYAHRLAWFLTHGYWPDLVDHCNRKRAENALSNLRETTPIGNAQNISHRARGLPPGVYPQSSGGRFRAAICAEGRQIHLGTFDTPDEAGAAYVAAKLHHHPTWSNDAEVIA